MRTLAGLILTVLGFGVATPGASQTAQRGFGLTMAVGQAGTPVRLVAARSTGDMIFEKVRIRNTGSQRVIGVTFGVFITPDSQGVPLLVTAAPVSADIEPLDEHELNTNIIDRNRANEILQQVAAVAAGADLGVLQVDFADGTTWTFQVDPLTGFRSVRADAVARAASSQCGKVAPDSRASGASIMRTSFRQGGGGYFTCEATGDCMVCTNTGSSCTMSVCGSYGQKPCVNCPMQQCFFHP